MGQLLVYIIYMDWLGLSLRMFLLAFNWTPIGTATMYYHVQGSPRKKKMRTDPHEALEQSVKTRPRGTLHLGFGETGGVDSGSAPGPREVPEPLRHTGASPEWPESSHGLLPEFLGLDRSPSDP